MSRSLKYEGEARSFQFYTALNAAMHTATLRNQTRLIRLSPRHEFRDEHRSRHGGGQSKLSKTKAFPLFSCPRHSHLQE